jgi:hypothetical protein
VRWLARRGCGFGCLAVQSASGQAKLQFRIRAEIDKSAVRRGLFGKRAAPAIAPVSGQPISMLLPEAVPLGQAFTGNTV